MSDVDNRKRFGGIALILWLIVGPALALWAAGCLFFLLHKSLPQHIAPWTWIAYARAYWDWPMERRLLVLSLVVPAALTLFPIGLILGWMGDAVPQLHGSARFASFADIKRAGLLGSNGIVVGKSQGRFLQFPGQQFCLLAAPTRSGKGVSFVIPNLLNWPDSCVVLDIKLENFLLTSKYRSHHGQEVFLFNPFAEDGRTHRWNPLSGVSQDPALRTGDLLALASSLYPALPGDRDAFWAESARNLFLGLALMLFETPGVPVTMGEILRQSAGEGAGLKACLSERMLARAATGTPFSSACVHALNRFLGASENTLANILSSFHAPLTLFANPLVDAATSASDFDIANVRDARMTIYIGIQPNRLGEAALLINIFFSQLINLNTRTLPSAGQHPYPCLLILDEFPALGKINILAKANAFIAGYNLRLLTIIQSIAQLEAVYGPQDARTLVTNHAMQVLFTPREQRDANAYSEMLGFYTVKSLSKGQSTAQGFGGGGSRSETTTDQRRALMLPQELKELPENEQIIILEVSRPIRCQKARFFENAAFLNRLKGLSPRLAAVRGLPSKAALDDVAFKDQALASAVPTLDVSAHLAHLAREDEPAPENGIDLSKLDIDPALLPPITDQASPPPEEVDAVVVTFFSLSHVSFEALDFECESEDADARMTAA